MSANLVLAEYQRRLHDAQAKILPNRLQVIRRRRFYERGIARIQDRWHGNGFSGEEFALPHHVYDSDLKILGAGSLFELMCTVRTGIGRRRLADYLLKPCDAGEAQARQESVRELTGQCDLRERVALLGDFDFQESTWDVFSEWIETPAQTVPNWLRISMIASIAALAALAIAGLSHAVPWSALAPCIAAVVALRMGIAYHFHARTNTLNAAASRVGSEIGVVQEGIVLIAGLTFRSAKLLAIQCHLGDAQAVQGLRRLEKLTDALSECAKPWFDLPSQVLNLKTQICFEIERWKLHHGRQLAGWLDAWGEFEALLAISGYTWEHPDDVFPEFVAGGTSFAACGLGHPLIPEVTCVRNDVELGSGNQFYVVSGSNMAGKSTLLRSIGLSVVLANAGAPVRASSLRLTRLNLFASLSIVDSVLEGKSKFLAEVERIRRMFEGAPEVPVLFLIDEILSGTNSRDRRIAAEAVVRALIARGAIGALSTHDLALTEIAGLDGLSGSNVHMGARPGQDPMDFDYLLKPGVTKETNALAIAAMMGVPIGRSVF